jgi:hypothetical protein
VNSQAMTKTEPRSFWDRLGVIGSVMCMVHCAATPLLIGFLSTLGLGFLGREIFHQFLHLTLVAIAIVAFLPAYRHHRRGWIIGAGALGALLLLIAGFGHEFLPSHADVSMTLAGSGILVVAHVFNRRCMDDDC